MAKFCSNCGKELMEGADVCTNCGKLVGASSAKQSEAKSGKYSQNGHVNRAALKAAAREKLKGNLWNIWKPMLVIFACGFVFGIIVSFFDQESFLYQLLTLAFEIIVLPLSAGLIAYLLHLTRGEAFDIKDLFKYFDKRIITLIVLELLISLFTILWSILFIIPGIIAAISYSLSIYIFVDETKTSPMDIIRESKRITQGNKWDLFVFGLSFILWDMLVSITFGIAAIYVVPYQSVALTMYYDELKAIKG